jgi:maltose O-acetyltransferase
MFQILCDVHSVFMRKRKERYIAGLVQNGLTLGKNVEIIDTFFFDPPHCFLISIGDNCTICPNVRLIAHDASTKKFLGYTKLGKITIKENCFIGDSVIVLPNVTIGPNSIIGAGSIVTRDIHAYSIAAGNPAKVISSLDDYLEKIQSLKRTKKVFDEK